MVFESIKETVSKTASDAYNAAGKAVEQVGNTFDQAKEAATKMANEVIDDVPKTIASAASSAASTAASVLPSLELTLEQKTSLAHDVTMLSNPLSAIYLLNQKEIELVDKAADSLSDEGASGYLKQGLQTANYVAKLGQTFEHATAYSAVQSPIDGIEQLANWGLKAMGGPELPPLQIIDKLPEAEFNTPEWYAQTIGTGVGIVIGFAATEGLGTAAMAAGRAGQVVEIGNAVLGAERVTQLGQVAKFAAKYPAIKTFANGLTFGFAAMPVEDANSPTFLQQRLQNGLVTAASGLLVGGGGAKLSEVASAALPNISTTAIKPLANMTAGYFTGVLNAEANSVLSGNGLTGDLQALHREGVTWAVMGLGSEAAGLGMPNAHQAESKTKPAEPNRAAETREGQPRESKNLAEPDTSAPNPSTSIWERTSNSLSSIKDGVIDKLQRDWQDVVDLFPQFPTSGPGSLAFATAGAEGPHIVRPRPSEGKNESTNASTNRSSQASDAPGEPASSRRANSEQPKTTFVDSAATEEITDRFLNHRLANDETIHSAVDGFLRSIEREGKDSLMTKKEYDQLNDFLAHGDGWSQQKTTALFEKMRDFAEATRSYRDLAKGIENSSVGEIADRAFQSGNTEQLNSAVELYSFLKRNSQLTNVEVETYTQRLENSDRTLSDDLKNYRSPAQIAAEKAAIDHKKTLEKFNGDESGKLKPANERVEKLSLPEEKKAEIRNQLAETRESIQSAREDLTNRLVDKLSSTSDKPFDTEQTKKQILESDLSPRALAKYLELVSADPANAKRDANSLISKLDAYENGLTELAPLSLPYKTASNAEYERLLTDMVVSSHVAEAQAGANEAPGMATYASTIKDYIQQNIEGIRTGAKDVPMLIDGTVGKVFQDGESIKSTPINPAGRPSVCSAAASAELNNRQKSPAELFELIKPGTAKRAPDLNYRGFEVNGQDSAKEFVTSIVPIRDGIPVTTAEQFQSHDKDRSGQTQSTQYRRAIVDANRPSPTEILNDGLYRINVRETNPTDQSPQGHEIMAEVRNGVAQVYDPLRGSTEVYDLRDPVQQARFEKYAYKIEESVQHFLGVEKEGAAGRDWVPE
ncbi:MAG: hypothetical protein JST89_18955 [Cyanobacteria bacterium SZAS-4]|nr:hypothetical protein [Cyanobacteria bacterium SZAS-4]